MCHGFRRFVGLPIVFMVISHSYVTSSGSCNGWEIHQQVSGFVPWPTFISGSPAAKHGPSLDGLLETGEDLLGTELPCGQKREKKKDGVHLRIQYGGFHAG